eukprot:TRINITY_DN4464_c0_g1_i2.p1 TRINITY_DN4464_c0_g1~~TRINITY_DN4464_c0_g1_i2.p1  ORF type:complete len:120 (-),score=31.41 TRINITY_DN4464_c0_g1_i2:180-539(-)
MQIRNITKDLHKIAFENLNVYKSNILDLLKILNEEIGGKVKQNQGARIEFNCNDGVLTVQNLLNKVLKENTNKEVCIEISKTTWYCSRELSTSQKMVESGLINDMLVFSFDNKLETEQI